MTDEARLAATKRYLDQLRAAALYANYAILESCPATQKELATALGCSVQKAGRRTIALEDAGLVVREGSPMTVRLTDEGDDVLHHIRETVDARVRDEEFEKKEG